jgi:carbonic anhydrase
MRASSRSIFALVVLSWCLALPSIAADPPFPLPWPKPATHHAYWETLMAGNATFVKGDLPYTGLAAQRTATRGGQEPPVAVLSCADSRVPPELVFGRAIGDLFVVREAGNVADTFSIASLEYSVSHHWTKLIVVLGHERCGAVIEALKDTDPGTPSLIALVKRIRDSFPRPDKGKKRDNIHAAVVANAKASADYLVAHSDVIAKAVKNKEVGIVVAYYNMGSGEVTKIR